MIVARAEGMIGGLKRIPKYICRDAKKIPEAPSVSSKSSDRAK